jgi:hypothetical protein
VKCLQAISYIIGQVRLVGWIPLTPWGGCGVGGGVREPSVGVENVVADQNGDIIQRLVCDETVRWLLGKAYRLFLGGHNEVRLFFLSMWSTICYCYVDRDVLKHSWKLCCRCSPFLNPCHICSPSPPVTSSRLELTVKKSGSSHIRFRDRWPSRERTIAVPRTQKLFLVT